MHSSRPSYLLTIFVYICYAVACQCSHTPDDSRYQKQDQKGVRRNATPRVDLLGSTHQFRPRALSDLTLIQFDHREALSPTLAAVQVLEHFYTQVALRADGPWATYSRRTWIRITLGSIQLFISATSGETIPWDFVSWHAMEMLKYTQKGYIGTHNAYFTTPDGGAGVIVSLTCRAIGALTSAAAVLVANGEGQALNAIVKPFNPP